MRDVSFGDLLTSYRNRLGWTQLEVVDRNDHLALKISVRTYQKWENGESIPSNKWLHRIANLFHLTEAEADELYRTAAQVAPEIENLPFQRNLFFTGRKTYLERLDRHLKENDSVALTQPVSISGLGGIGKTQLALEYAHLSHPKMYRAVFWVNAADKVALEASYVSLARLLNLPKKDDREVDLIVQEVKKWLKEHTGWLLILDNADDLQLARSFLPTKHHGHILFTTRSQIVGNIAVQIEIEAMEPEEGLHFLLLRSGMLKRGSAPNSVASDIRNSAEQIVKTLEGHPLALDQAGAYIEETKDSFAAYMQLYSDQRLVYLNERGLLGDEHPETVVVTFGISFQRAYKLYPAAADVLHFCSFLHADDIPEELFSQDSGLNLNKTTLNNAVRALRRYSLIKRDPVKKAFSIHRLVQTVLIDAMPEKLRKQWKECVVQALHEAFPEGTFGAFKEWTRCGRLLPHVLVCATWIEHEPIPTPEASHVLDKAGTYLRERAQYSEAESLLVQAISIREQHLGAEHPNTAMSLNNLAILYWYQGKYEQAEPLYLRAISIQEQHLGVEHPDTATSLHSLAALYWEQGRYEQAEPLMMRVLSMREQHLGVEHLDTAMSLNSLALLYRKQGKYEQAEPLYQRALSIYEQHLGAEHPDTAYPLHGLAELSQHQGKYEQTEALYQRALAIREKRLGPTHLETQETRKAYTALLRIMGRDAEATALDMSHEPPTE